MQSCAPQQAVAGPPFRRFAPTLRPHIAGVMHSGQYVKYFIGLFVLVLARVFVALGVIEYYLLFIGKTHFMAGRELGVVSGSILLIIGMISSFFGWYLSFGVYKGAYQILFQSIAIVGAVLGINALFNFSGLSNRELSVALVGASIAAGWWYWSNRGTNA